MHYGVPGLISVVAGIAVAFGFILLLSSGKHQSFRVLRAVGSVLIGIPVGVLTYGWFGILLGRTPAGFTRFYSFPVGGHNYARVNIYSSIAIWSVFWIAAIFIASHWIPTEHDDRKLSANR